jgi:hypothetical protein
MDSPRQMLAARILDMPVKDYITNLRSHGLSWRRIAQTLREDTGGVIDVTDQTLRSWAR